MIGWPLTQELSALAGDGRIAFTSTTADGNVSSDVTYLQHSKGAAITALWYARPKGRRYAISAANDCQIKVWDIPYASTNSREIKIEKKIFVCREATKKSAIVRREKYTSSVVYDHSS
jgi:WD40 repeat protein